MKKFSEVEKAQGKLDGSKVHLEQILNRPVRVLAFDISNSKHNSEKCLTLQYEIEEGEDKKWAKHITFTGSKNLIKQIEGIGPEDFPFEAKIIKQPLDDGRRCFYKFIDP
jgi:hypothetical protein